MLQWCCIYYEVPWVFSLTLWAQIIQSDVMIFNICTYSAGSAFFPFILSVTHIIEWITSSITARLSVWVRNKAVNQLYLNPVTAPSLNKQMDETESGCSQREGLQPLLTQVVTQIHLIIGKQIEETLNQSDLFPEMQLIFD